MWTDWDHVDAKLIGLACDPRLSTPPARNSIGASAGTLILSLPHPTDRPPADLTKERSYEKFSYTRRSRCSGDRIACHGAVVREGRGPRWRGCRANA